MLQLPAGREASRGERAPQYESHRPERTLLYQIIEEYYPAFEAQWAAEGRVLPDYVRQEFDGYLSRYTTVGGTILGRGQRIRDSAREDNQDHEEDPLHQSWNHRLGGRRA
jgi:hypothetical protein